MAKILVVVDNELNSDARVLREIDLLIAEGYIVECVCYDYGQARKKERKDIKIHRITISKSLRDKLLPLVHVFPFFNALWKKHLVKVINNFSPEYIIANDLYMAKPTRRAIDSCQAKSRLILDLHENYPVAVQSYGWNRGLKKIISLSHLWKVKEEEYLNHADHIIVLHEAYKKQLSKRYSGLPAISIFPNVLNVDKYAMYPMKRIELPFNNDYPVLFYFGVVGKRRGIFDCFRVLEMLSKKGNYINLLVVGPVDSSDSSDFENWINKKTFNGYVEHEKWIDIRELPSYMKAVDACVAPFEVNDQHNSGVANKIFQYMYGSKPIIASNCEPQADLIHSANCGKIYNNLDEFCDELVHLSSHKDEWNQMGKNGYGYLIKNYSLDVVKKDFMSIFQDDNKG